MPLLRSICVFCGSSVGRAPLYQAMATHLARTLARRNLRLVYGGGNIGLMGLLANEVLSQGGEVTGVIPHALATKEIAHWGLTKLHVVTTMHERKALMADLADGFIALPGGIGTLEEWMEIFTWAALGLHPKPFGLLNVEGFFDPLLVMIDRMVETGFLKATYRDLIQVATDPESLLNAFERYTPPAIPQWILDEER